MSNILWVQPNGVLALTSVFPSTMEDMERASEIDAKLPALNDLDRQYDQLQGKITDYPYPEEYETSEAFDAACDVVTKENAPIHAEMLLLAKAIEQRKSADEVKANTGLNLAEHAALLQTPHGPDQGRNIPENWTLAGSDVDWPETGWAHEAHRWDGKKIVVDLEAAREETKIRLRRERTPLYEVNDLRLRDAILEGDETKRLAGIAERDRLRGLTKRADEAATLNELKALSVDA